MKKLCIIVAVVLLSQALLAQKTKEIKNTEAKEVRVYQQGALVTRVAKTSVEAGTTSLQIVNLSPNIDKQSISVGGKGALTILSVTHELNYLKNPEDVPELTELQDSLDKMSLNLERMVNMKTVYQEEQSLLLFNKTVGGANAGLSAEVLEDVADLYRTRLMDIKEKILEISRKEKIQRELFNKLTAQVNQLNTQRNVPTSVISVEVSAEAHTPAEIILTYYVGNAGWSPVYDLRAKNTNSLVQLAYRANVYQHTGEAWKNVQLTLSTGNPALGGVKPVLSPWELDFYYQVMKIPGKSRTFSPEPQQAMPSSVAKEEGIALDMDKQVNMQQASTYVEVDQHQLSTDFDISIPYSIPSDGKSHSVEIRNYDVPAQYTYYAVPKLDKDAFLTARLTGFESLNLLPGQARVYFDGNYIAESYLDPNTTNDTLNVSLGRDKRLSITRDKLKEFSGNKFMGNEKVKELVYEISIRNMKKEPITIVIEDQVPVSKNKEIAVKVNELSGAAYNETTGKLEWNITVAPSETQKRKLAFSVKSPKDKIIPGF